MANVAKRLSDTLLGVNRRNVAALVAVTGLIAAAHLLFPNWATVYAAWLTAFSIWMLWFVLTFVRWMGQVDDEP